MSIVALVQLMCGQSYGRDFTGVASDVTQRHTVSEQTPYPLTLAVFLSAPSFLRSLSLRLGNCFVAVSLGTGLHNSAF